MLKCETNTPTMCGRILSAAYASFSGEGPFDACFEHGHWWIFNISSGQTFSVVDCEGEGYASGFDFEEG